MGKMTGEIISFLLTHIFGRIVHPEIAQILEKRLPGYIELIIECMNTPELIPEERLILCDAVVSELIKILNTAEVIDYFEGKELKKALIAMFMGFVQFEVKHVY